MANVSNNNQEHSSKEVVRQFVEAQLCGREPDIEELVKKYPKLEHQIRQKIEEFRKVDSLFDSLVKADRSDFEDAATGGDLVGRRRSCWPEGRELRNRRGDWPGGHGGGLSGS